MISKTQVAALLETMHAEEQQTREDGQRERWLSLPGSPGYKVSSTGDVRRLGGTRLAQSINPKTGYVTVHVGRVTRNVHALVALAFHGPCPKGKEVNHIDTIRTNNTDTNLEYMTRSENMRHAYANRLPTGARLTPDKVKQIRRLRASCSLRELANRFGVAKGTIVFITTGKTWEWVK